MGKGKCMFILFPQQIDTGCIQMAPLQEVGEIFIAARIAAVFLLMNTPLTHGAYEEELISNYRRVEFLRTRADIFLCVRVVLIKKVCVFLKLHTHTTHYYSTTI